MKKLLFTLILTLCFGISFSFAIYQKVNEINGENYGYIKKIYQYQGRNYLKIDYIQVFNGKEQVQARIEDWKCKIQKNTGKRYTRKELLNIVNKTKFVEGRPEEGSTGQKLFTNTCLYPNSYVRNVNKQLRTYKISPNIKISTVNSGEVSISDFVNQFNNNGLYYKVLLKNKIIVEIQEIYQS